MSILDPKADVAAITPELDKSVQVIANAISGALAPFVPLVQTLFDGYTINISIDVKKKK